MNQERIDAAAKAMIAPSWGTSDEQTKEWWRRMAKIALVAAGVAELEAERDALRVRIRDLLDTSEVEGLDDRYDTVAGMIAAALEKGYTQGQLAEKVGVSRRTVYAWLHKQSLPSDEHYAVIRALVRADAMDVLAAIRRAVLAGKKIEPNTTEG